MVPVSEKPLRLKIPSVVSGNTGPTRRWYTIKTPIHPVMDTSITTDHWRKTGNTADNLTHYLSDIKSVH